MSIKYDFDPLCLELAAHFLPDGTSENAKLRLAQAIQNTIDAHLLNSSEPISTPESKELSQ